MKMTYLKQLSGLLFGAFCLTLAPAHAALISPITATVESGTAWNAGGGVGELIDGDTTPGPNWFGFRPLSGSQDDRVRLTLDGSYDLNSVSIWNNGGGIDNDSEGLRNFLLTFMDDSLTTLGTYSGTLLDLQTIQTQGISASGVSVVDLTFQTSHGAGYAVITEIQFDGSASVPVPHTLGLIMSLGLLLFARRHNATKRT